MLKQVKSITDLIDLLPRLTRLYEDLDGLWESDLDVGEFAANLVREFQHGGLLFVEVVDNVIKYVIMIKPDTKERWFFYLFYMNKSFRHLTRQTLEELRYFCHKQGVKQLRFTTTRVTRSYERWVEKFGAKRHSVTYQLDI